MAWKYKVFFKKNNEDIYSFIIKGKLLGMSHIFFKVVFDFMVSYLTSVACAIGPKCYHILN